MRRRVRSRVLTSILTATRNFDLQLAIATLRLPAELYAESGRIPVVYGGNTAELYSRRGPARARSRALRGRQVPTRRRSFIRAGRPC
jgi:hypothetical protein